MGRLPEGIQAQLLALGIPAAKHTQAALGAFFPRELNVEVAALDAEDLARVLVYFADRGVFHVHGAGHRALIKDVAPGWHCCQFYRDEDDLLALVAPYIAEGLHNGEACLWVLPSSVPLAHVREVLAPFADDVDARMASGQLEILSHDRWYLDASGRFKSWEDIRDGLLDRQDRALARGFRFLRAAGDSGWISGTEESREFIDYEMKVNAAIGHTKIAAICTYRADVTADELVAIVTAHQDAIYNPVSP